MEYRPDKFSDLAEVTLGKELWGVLNQRDNIIRMETAIDLGKPAAEAVAKVLLQEFGSDVKVTRVKQMIGHMIRQIMETRGFQLDSQNVRVGTKRLFSKASRFRDGDGKTTKIDYLNRNNQLNCGHRNIPGTDNNAIAYKLECQFCSYEYGSNGTDIFQRKCPNCQGGRPGIKY